MNTWIILGIVAVAGLALLVIYSLLAMAAGRDRKALELAGQQQPPGSTGGPSVNLRCQKPYNWCSNCQAFFIGKICPGCAPDESPEN